MHVVPAPEVTLAGLQTSEETDVIGVTVTVAVAVPLSVAVTVAVWGDATEPAVATNEADVWVAGTVTDGGTGSAAVFEASVTTRPPLGAGRFNVTVHVVEAPDVTLVGLQTSDDTATLGVTVTVAVALVPSVAVSVTLCEVATEPPVAVNVVVVAVAGTVTEAGTGRAAVLLDASATTLPPVGAA